MTIERKHCEPLVVISDNAIRYNLRFMLRSPRQESYAIIRVSWNIAITD